ncbi:hypothetical protein ACROYT_G025905 [Oculina patagonica]
MANSSADPCTLKRLNLPLKNLTFTVEVLTVGLQATNRMERKTMCFVFGLLCFTLGFICLTVRRVTRTGYMIFCNLIGSLTDQNIVLTAKGLSSSGLVSKYGVGPRAS